MGYSYAGHTWVIRVNIYSTFGMWHAYVGLDIYGTKGFIHVSNSVQEWWHTIRSWEVGRGFPVRGNLIGVLVIATADGTWPWDHSAGSRWLDDRQN